MADEKNTPDQPEAGTDSTPGEGPVIADRDANAALEHSVDPTGPTTRSDATDAGVPMLAGDPAEPIGPEDAFGPGPKRGDYAGRESSLHTSVERIPEDERGDAFQWVDGETGAPAKEGAKGAVRSPLERPATRLVDQNARAGEQGDAPGKGGVPGTGPRDDVAAGAPTAG